MSRTIIHQQCRTLPRVLSTSPSLHHDRNAHNYSTSLDTRSPRRCQSERQVHTARAHSHRVQPSPMSRQDIDHELLKSKELKADLRLLLRDIAQPVAVVTSFMPGYAGSPSYAGDSAFSSTLAPNDTLENVEMEHDSKFHGATLSSFTSIAMDPYPLVAFALRIPSRMATTLSSLSSIPSSSQSSNFPPRNSHSSHMVINLLSASQASAAITFSRPDLYPTPFVSGSHSGKHEYSLSKDGLPILHNVVGALSCRLVGGPIPLHDLDYLGSGIGAKAAEPTMDDGCVASELFIARVTRVEKIRREVEGGEEDNRTLPLVYHRRSYTSCHPQPGKINDKKM